MTGIQEYKTKSGYQVARIHYTADPAKNPNTQDGMDWLKRALTGVKGGLSSSAWRKEMEIDFKARSGQKVFQGLELLRDKILIKPFNIPQYWQVGGGYDWGKRNPYAYVEGATDKDGNKYMIYGASASGVEIPAQAEVIKRSPYYDSLTTRYADPSIWTEDQVSKDGSYTSFQRVFQEYGIFFTKGKTDDIACMERLESEWFDIQVSSAGEVVKVPKENPTFKIFWTMEWLFDCLCNLRWSEFGAKTENEKGKKEEIAHSGNDPWDALKYWYLSLPLPSMEPKPKSQDPALPLAGELINVVEESEYKKWMRS